MKRYGSRAEVYHGTAEMTTGRLTKKSFTKNKIGRIVSKIKMKHAKDKNKNPLLKLGYQRKKGSKEFGPNKLESNNNKSKKKNNNKSKRNNKSNNKSPGIFKNLYKTLFN
jgi:hypothetical protein